MVTRYNFVKKLVGMYLVQTSVIFFLVSISAKKEATVPVLLSLSQPVDVDASHYMNPLPHVLTLTAIVVGVATLGVALALCAAIYRNYGSLDEEEILKRLE